MSGQIKRTTGSIEDGTSAAVGVPDQTAFELRIAEASARRAKALSDKTRASTPDTAAPDSGIPASIRRADLPPMRPPASAPVLPVANATSPVTPLRPVPPVQKPDSEITAGDLLNPAALELRLADARARRNSALAERAAGNPGKDVATQATEPALLRAPDASERLSGHVATSKAARSGSLFMGITFAAGLMIGGAVTALIASPDLRTWVVGSLSGGQSDSIADAGANTTSTIAADPVQVPQPEPQATDVAVVTVPRPVTYDKLTALPALQYRASTLDFASVVSDQKRLQALPGVIPPTEPPESVTPWAYSTQSRHPISVGLLPGQPDTLTSLRASVSAPQSAEQNIAIGLPAALGAPAPAGVSENLTALRVAAPPLPLADSENAWKSAITVYVHYPPSAEVAAQAAVAELRANDISDVTSIAAGFSISASNIRYYHDSDLAAAAALAATLSNGTATQDLQARDFTSFRPQPKTGLVEVWLAGTAPTARKTTTTRPTEVSDARQQQLVEAARRTAQQREVERLLINRLGNN